MKNTFREIKGWWGELMKMRDDDLHEFSISYFVTMCKKFYIKILRTESIA